MVDENTVFFSGLTDKTRAKVIVALSGNTNESAQADECAVEKVQTVINDEDDQETGGQLPVSSKQQVGKPLFVYSEFDDTAELNFDASDFTTTNQSIGDEVFTKHSSSISRCRHATSYPETIDGCIKVINELRQALKALHLTINENEVSVRYFILWVSVELRLVCSTCVIQNYLRNYQRVLYRTVCLQNFLQNYQWVLYRTVCLQNYLQNFYESSGQRIVDGFGLLDEYPRFGIGMDYVTYRSWSWYLI